MNNFYIATVSKIELEEKPKRFVIRFSIDDFITDAKAYPLETDETPEVGDKVAIWAIDNILGQSFIYQKLRTEDFTQVRYNNNRIKLDEDSINIESDDSSKLKTYGIAQPSTTGAPGDPTIGPYNCITICPLTGMPHCSSNVILTKAPII